MKIGQWLASIVCVLAVTACTPEAPAGPPRWERWPVKGTWLPTDTIHMEPERFAWQTPEGEPVEITFTLHDREPETGVAKSISMVATLGEKRATWAIERDTYNIYEPFMSGGWSEEGDWPYLEVMNVAGWRVWQAYIGPTTNGDPPHFDLWLIEDPKRESIVLAGGSGTGLAAYRATDERLELVLRDQHENDSAGEGELALLPWLIRRQSGALSAERQPYVYLFALDGTAAGLWAREPRGLLARAAEHYARPVRRNADFTWSTLAATRRTPREPFPWTPFPGWLTAIDHYTTGDFRFWQWSWRGEVEPNVRLVAPDDPAVAFKWREQVTVLDAAGVTKHAPEPMYLDDAQVLVMRGWRVVLTREPDGRVEAGAIVPPPAVAGGR